MFKDVGCCECIRKNFCRDLQVSILFDKIFEHINTIKNYNKEKYEARFSDYRRNNKKKLEEYFDGKVAGIPVSKQLAVIDKSVFFVSGDYNSFLPYGNGSS